MQLADLTGQSSITIGTGNMVCSPLDGLQQFSAIFGTGTGNPFPYFISNPSAFEWETGIGYMFDSVNLVRSSVVSSSNSNELVNFSVGTKTISNDLPAAYQVLPFKPPRIITAAGPGIISNADNIVHVNQMVGAAYTFNINPTLLNPGQKFVIKDEKGDAATNNITLQPTSGQFDGSSNYQIEFAYGAITFATDGTNFWGY